MPDPRRFGAIPGRGPRQCRGQGTDELTTLLTDPEVREAPIPLPRFPCPSSSANVSVHPRRLQAAPPRSVSASGRDRRKRVGARRSERGKRGGTGAKESGQGNTPGRKSVRPVSHHVREITDAQWMATSLPRVRKKSVPSAMAGVARQVSPKRFVAVVVNSAPTGTTTTLPVSLVK